LDAVCVKKIKHYWKHDFSDQYIIVMLLKSNATYRQAIFVGQYCHLTKITQKLANFCIHTIDFITQLLLACAAKYVRFNKYFFLFL